LILISKITFYTCKSIKNSPRVTIYDTQKSSDQVKPIHVTEPSDTISRVSWLRLKVEFGVMLFQRTNE